MIFDMRICEIFLNFVISIYVCVVNKFLINKIDSKSSFDKKVGNK